MYNKRIIMLVVIEFFIIVISIAIMFYLIRKDSTTYLIKKGNMSNILSSNEELKNITIYQMTQEEMENLASKEITDQSEEEIKNVSEEQNVEDIYIEQKTVKSVPDVSLGNYVGLTYYSQIDSRWRNYPYTSTGNSGQTIGTSGCGPTVGAMVVTATKGTITPPEMGDLFVMYGYRSANSGTYWSAFNFVANTFGLEYQETGNFDEMLNLLRNNYYVVVSCGKGLFTDGGHFVLLTGINGDTISVYDPYLYNGKFNTPDRRGKVTLNGTTAYVSVDNFRNYANYRRFFMYKHGNSSNNNNFPEQNISYIRYVNARIGLNVRNAPNGRKIGALTYGTKVTVYETKNGWSRIGTNRWVSSQYLSGSLANYSKYILGNYKVTASVLRVRFGPGLNYSPKIYNQLTVNARKQNRQLGNYYTNGYRRGVICTVDKIQGNWGHTPSGWVCLNYCTKL